MLRGTLGRALAAAAGAVVLALALAGAQPAPEAGSAFRDCAACPVMVVVPAGTFVMGLPPDEPERWPDEGPQREVTIPRPFALARLEVTAAEWAACVDAGGCVRTADWCVRSSTCRLSGFVGEGLPAAGLSWDDARAYAAWLSLRTGYAYRLPSEAEWEYSARAGTAAPYWWGDEVGRNNASCNGCGGPWDGRQPAPAGSFAANGFGLSDMHGSMWEWVEDCWHPGYAGAPSGGEAWLTDCSLGSRVLRGGGWIGIPGDVRAAIRSTGPTDTREPFLGARMARDL